MIHAEHWIIDQHNTVLDSVNRTPRSTDRFLIPCQGCNIHNPIYYTTLTVVPKCVFYIPNDKTIKIETRPPSNSSFSFSTNKKIS